MRRRRVISPGFTGHYQDVGMSNLLILSMGDSNPDSREGLGSVVTGMQLVHACHEGSEPDLGGCVALHIDLTCPKFSSPSVQT